MSQCLTMVLTEAQRGMHMEGDTPTSSEHGDYDDLEGTSETESESSYDDVFVSVLDRKSDDGHLKYKVEYADSLQSWIDRSDAWDFATNTAKIVAYDRAHPISWDEECLFCATPFSGPMSTNPQFGCDECVCPECNRRCCHLLGINYGCIRHPVI